MRKKIKGERKKTHPKQDANRKLKVRQVNSTLLVCSEKLQFPTFFIYTHLAHAAITILFEEVFHPKYHFVSPRKHDEHCFLLEPGC